MQSHKKVYQPNTRSRVIMQWQRLNKLRPMLLNLILIFLILKMQMKP